MGKDSRLNLNLYDEFGLGDVEVHINKMNNANLIGTGIAALS